MICARHSHTSLTPTGGYYGEYGLWMCWECFEEAVANAEAQALEARVAAAFRVTSTTDLMRRLGWRS